MLPQRRLLQRETLEESLARREAELHALEMAAREAELKAREAELEALITHRMKSGLAIEGNIELEWDEYEETFFERLIRRSGRWGFALLALSGVIRWVAVVLGTVLGAGLLILALDRSTDAQGELPEQPTQVIVEAIWT